MKTTKKYLSLVCCAICAIATCLALVACGGGTAAKGAKMVGYWELVSGKADGTELTEDDIQMMNDWGMKVVLYLGEDGKATLDLFGEVQDSTWDIEKCTLGYDGETGTLELADDKLTFAAGRNVPRLQEGRRQPGRPDQDRPRVREDHRHGRPR